MQQKPKSVQISEQLVIELCKWFLCGERTPEREALIVKGLQDKVDAATRRSLYKTTHDASKSAQERTEAFKAYLAIKHPLND